MTEDRQFIRHYPISFKFIVQLYCIFIIIIIIIIVIFVVNCNCVVTGW